jgi:hypothetical protein
VKKLNNGKNEPKWGLGGGHGNVTTKPPIPLFCTHAMAEKQINKKKKKHTV